MVWGAGEPMGWPTLLAGWLTVWLADDRAETASLNSPACLKGIAYLGKYAYSLLSLELGEKIDRLPLSCLSVK